MFSHCGTTFKRSCYSEVSRGGPVLSSAISEPKLPVRHPYLVVLLNFALILIAGWFLDLDIMCEFCHGLNFVLLHSKK